MAKKSTKPPAKSNRWAKKKVRRGRRKERKLGGWWLVANVVSFGLVIGTAAVIFFGDRPGGDRPSNESQSPADTQVALKPTVATDSITVYFGSPDGESLTGKSVAVKSGSLKDKVAEAVKRLIDGPDNSGARRGKRAEKTLPQGTRLLGVRLTGGTAIINLSKEVAVEHNGGTAAEIQTIYSIVNTVALGWPEIRDVQILIDGERRETLAGHIGIKVPLRPDRTINAE